MTQQQHDNHNVSGISFSLAQMSATARVGLVLVPVALIWVAIWALLA